MSTTFDVPAELKEKQAEFLSELKKKNGSLRVGVNEVTKAIEREQAKLVYLAKDVSPVELTMHIPLLCKEKHIPYTFVETRKELGEHAGLGIAAAAVAVTEGGDSQSTLEELIKKVQPLNK